MSEGAPKWKADDLDRMAEIESLRAELLASEQLPEGARGVIEAMPVEQKFEEIAAAVEDGERKTDESSREAQFGQERTPIMRREANQLKWDLKGEQFREEGKTMVELAFKRSDGIEIQPGGGERGKGLSDTYERFIPLDEYKALKKGVPEYLQAVKKLTSEDDAEKEAARKYLSEFREKHKDSEWAVRALRHLNSLAVHPAEDVVERDPYFVETPHVTEVMEKFARLINRQRERGQGIVILEGDAGTGKNKIVDHFAHMTNRPLFRFTCSAGKDEQDLKYLLEYDSKKGTYRIKSTVVEALETPGAILELDEINTLKPEVAKMLNSLFDHDRALFTGEDRTAVHAEDEVVMVGLQNPQHYMGVSPLAETIKSRARIMEVSYPPFQRGRGGPREPYASDEAMILRKHMPDLAGTAQETFQKLWDAVVNRHTEPFRIPPRIREQIIELKEIVALANKVRRAYRDYHEGKSDNPVQFVFSLRESVESAYELGHVELTDEEKKGGVTKAKRAISEVVLPKVPAGEERLHLSTLIART